MKPETIIEECKRMKREAEQRKQRWDAWYNGWDKHFARLRAEIAATIAAGEATS